MIKTLYTIGRIIQNDEEYSGYFEPWENPFINRNPEEAKVIELNIKDGKIIGEPDIVNFTRSKVNKYLFREAKANATNLVPTFYYQVHSDKKKQKDEIDKKLKKIQASIKNYTHTFLDEKELEKLPELLSKLKLNTNNIYLITFKIDGKYFGDFDKYKKLFYDEAFDKYRKDSNAKNKVCAVTYQQSDEVWGRVNTLGFTVNDVSFSRNGFNQKDSYKMFPVSPKAVKILEGTKRFIENELSYDFYGLKFYIVPHFVAIHEKLAEDIIHFFIRKSKSNNLEAIDKVLFRTETILKEIAEEKKLNQSNVYYDIFFYQKSNQQYLIKLHLSDVLPSQFKKIFKVKEYIEHKYQLINRIIVQAKGNESEMIFPFYINFGIIKNFFSKKVKTNTIYHPYFFKILEAVFYGNKLNEQTIIKAFMNEIKISFKNQHENKYQFTNDVKHSFTIYKFFKYLNLLKNTSMEINNNEIVKLTLDGFIDQHLDFFKSDYKKIAFYLGCLTEKICEKQRSTIKSEPFLKNLNGLNIDIQLLKKIHLKILDKKYQYNDKFKKEEHEYFEKLNAEISSKLIDFKDYNKLELSYAFAAGLVMQKEFTNQYFRDLELKKETEN